MQVIKLKARLIIAGIIALILALLVAFLMGTSILTGFIGGNQSQIDIQNTGCRDAITSGGHTAGDDPAPPSDVAKEQEDVVRQIEQGVKESGVDGRAVRIVAIAAYGESTLTNIDYGDAETSGVTNADGSLTTSIGILQQQDNWGTKEQRMNPKEATKSFLLGINGNRGLLDLPGWEDMEPTVAIHEVQVNADPQHYAAYYSAADEVIKRAGVDTKFKGKTSKDGAESQGGSGSDGAPDRGDSGPTSCGDPSSKNNGKGQDAKNTYAWDDITPRDSMKTDPMNFYYGECTSYAGFKINEFLGQSPEEIKSKPIFTNAIAGDGASWGHAWEANGWKVSDTPVPNSVAWWDANDGQGIGPSGHVAWTEDVKDGKAVIDEYNNSYLGGGPHRYSAREPMSADDSQAPTAYLVPPKADQIKNAGPKVG